MDYRIAAAVGWQDDPSVERIRTMRSVRITLAAGAIVACGAPVVLMAALTYYAVGITPRAFTALKAGGIAGIPFAQYRSRYSADIPVP